MRAPDHLPPFPIKLQRVAADLRLGVRALAKATGVSKSALQRVIASNVWPKSTPRDALEQQLLAQCIKAGATAAQLKGLFLPQIRAAPPQKGKAARARAKAASHPPANHHHSSKPEDQRMLLPKLNLTMEARKAFDLSVNPFDGEVETADQMFHNAEFRYVREACWQAALHGRFVAVVGESGAGKTTMLGDLRERIELERKPVVLITPSVIGMEETEKTGRTLRVGGIMDAIAYSIQPGVKLRQTAEARDRQLQQMLQDSASAGNVHLVVIEEAHCLPTSTLKHLKRLHEMRMGRRPLLGILLMGQPELMKKLNPKRQDLREVTQRVEVVTLLPLDSDLKAYLAKRLARAGKRVDDVMDDGAIDAVRLRLTVQPKARPGDGPAPTQSQVYPLAVNNFMCAVLNTAASLGMTRITRDVVMAV